METDSCQKLKGSRDGGKGIKRGIKICCIHGPTQHKEHKIMYCKYIPKKGEGNQEMNGKGKEGNGIFLKKQSKCTMYMCQLSTKM